MKEALIPVGSGEEWTAEQLLYLLGLYQSTLDKLGYRPIAYPDPNMRAGSSLMSAPKFDCLNHAYWMCGCVQRFMRENRVARAYRWMGMIQGLLFMGGVYSLEELSEQERHVPGPGRPKSVREALDRCPTYGDA